MQHLQDSKSKAILIYIYDDIEKKATGEAGNWWLRESLKKLERSLKKKFKIKLIVTSGEVEKTINELIQKYNINEVIWNRLYSKKSIERDSQIKKNLQEKKNQSRNIQRTSVK